MHKLMPKPNEASSFTEDYADDAAKYSECDSSSLKGNKGFYASKLNRKFGTAQKVVGRTWL